MRTNNPRRPGTTRARYHRGNGGSNTFTAGSDAWRWVGRDTITFPRDVLAMRMGFANMNMNAVPLPTTQAGALTIEGCSFERPLIDAARPHTGFFRRPPVSVIPSFSIPSDGTEGVSNWCTDRTVLPKARVKYAYSYSVLAATSGTKIVCTSDPNMAFGNLVSVSSLAQANAMHTPDGIAGRGSNQPTQSGYTLGVYWFEVILDGDIPVVSFLGDSIPYGYTSKLSGAVGVDDVFSGGDESYFGRAGIVGGFAAQNLAIGGLLASNIATDPFADYRWSRAGWDDIQPSAVILAVGRNDASNNASLTSIQASMQTCMDNIRTRAPNAKIYLVTYPPGGFANTGSTTVNGAGQTPGSGGTLVVASTGFPAVGSLVVAGLTGLLHYTGKTSTSFTGCSGATGTATAGGAVTSDNNKPTSQDVINLNALSAWTSSLPYGVHGCIDFDAALNPAGTPLDASGNVVGDARLMTPINPHPTVRGVAAMQQCLPSFGGRGITA